jgi:peptidyl-prolyl cis-trans isomerase A (cyclophilin A)
MAGLGRVYSRGGGRAASVLPAEVSLGAPLPPSHGKTPMPILMTTSLGPIEIELDHAKAPISAKNFEEYAKAGHYDGTIFHRVISNFMIQGGGFTPDMNQKKTSAGIANEWRNGLKNTRGTLAMARLGGRPDSATSQFFVNVVDNPFLDQPQDDGAAYAVFGKVTKGMDIVDKIRAVPTGRSGMHSDVPKTPVVIESVKVL